jgi:hypothetical protein
MQEALEVYNYLKNNPTIAQQVSQGDVTGIQNNPAFSGLNPINNQIQDLNLKLASIELDNNINQLKSKYTDFNEVEVLTEAERLGVTDLEFVYNALQGRKMPDMKEQLRKEIEQSIVNKFKQNAIETETIINQNDSNTAQHSKVNLTPIELQIAANMGLTPEEYIKGKS